MKKNNCLSELFMVDTKRILLERWSEHSIVFKWLHFRSSQILKRRSFSLSVPLLVLNTISGGFIYNTELFSNTRNSLVIFEVLVGSLNMLCAILAGIRDYCKYGELGELHEQCYQNWTRFKNELNVELALIEDESIPTFLSNMKSRYIELITSSPTIPLRVIRDFEKEFQNNDIDLPDIVNGQSSILLRNKPKMNSFEVDLDRIL